MNLEDLELSELLKLRSGLNREVAKRLPGDDSTQEDAIARKSFDADDEIGESHGVSDAPIYDHGYDFDLVIPFTKADGDKRLVTGIVLEPDEVDSQNDTIKADVIEKAAHGFLARFNVGTQMGVMHKMFGEIGVRLAESYIAPMDFKLGGQTVKKGSWLMTVKVEDASLWNRIKRGEITGFSIGGVAAIASS